MLKTPKLIAPLFLIAIGTLAACDDDGTGIAQLDARMEIDPPILDFGNVQIGTTITKEVFIRNTGEELLVYVSATSPPFDMRSRGSGFSYVPPGS